MSDFGSISATELERLSAYLDGELKAGEAAELEARLRQDAELRQTLRELERTVEAVRLLPAAAPPRDFRLTQQMVADSRGGLLARLEAGVSQLRLYPVLQLGTALAALALVTLAGFDVLVNNALAGIQLEPRAELAFESPGAGAELDQPLTMADDQAQQTAEAEQALRAAEAPAAAPLEPAAGTPDAAALEGEAEEEAAAEAVEGEAEEGAAAEAGEGETEEEAAAEAVAGEVEEDTAADAVEGEPSPQAASEVEPEAGLAAAPEPEAGEPMEPEPLSTPAALAERPAADRLFDAPEARTALTLAELGLAAATLLLLVFTLRERRRA